MADKYYSIPDKPVYSRNVRELQNDDPSNAELTFNPLIMQLLENIAAVKELADSALKLAQPRKIGNASFDGSADITLEQMGAAASSHTHPVQTSVSGNAGTADKLKTARKIGNASFDGSANITLEQMGAAASGHTHPAQTSVSGNAGTANKLKTARKIGNASFDGSADVTLTQIGAAAASSTQITTQAALDATTRRSGFYTVSGFQPSGITDGPSNKFYHLIELGEYSPNHAQIIVPYGNTQSNSFMWFRMHNGTNWLPWRQVITTNYGNAVSAAKLQTARTINGRSFDGSANITTAYSCNLIFPNAGNAASYAVFARTSNANSTGNCGATLLVSGCGNFGGTLTGVWLIQLSNRGSTPTMSVTTLQGNNSGTVTFGYYTANNYFYFGVYCQAYAAGVSVTVLRNTDVNIANHYNSATAPSGWTAVTPRILRDSVYTHPTSAGNKHIPAGGSSGQILRWSSDGTAAWGADNNTTYGNMKAATASAAGGAGLVPAPAAGAQAKYLRGDGTWQNPPNTTYSAATQSANGLMSAADKTKLDKIAAEANKYSHPTTSGNKHIPAGGSSGQILRWSSDGTAAWGADNNTTYGNMKAATASAAGGAGLVPAPAAGAQSKYLRGDGTWQNPPNTTYSAATQSANGLMSAADKKKLDGIAASANNYSHPTSAGNKHIPAGGSAGQILKWSAAGTAAWGATPSQWHHIKKYFELHSSNDGGNNIIGIPLTHVIYVQAFIGNMDSIAVSKTKKECWNIKQDSAGSDSLQVGTVIRDIQCTGIVAPSTSKTSDFAIWYPVKGGVQVSSSLGIGTATPGANTLIFGAHGVNWQIFMIEIWHDGSFAWNSPWN